MKCPKCGHDNPAGTAICAKCDNILDKSFLGDGFTDEPEASGEAVDFGDNTDRSAPPPPEAGQTEIAPPPTRRSSRRPKPATDPGLLAAKTARKAASLGEEPTEHKAESLPDARKQKRTAQDTPVESAFAPEEGESLKAEGQRMAAEIRVQVRKGWSFYQALRLPEKIALGGAAATFLFSFFPWVRFPPLDSISGVDLGGLFAVLLSVGCGVVVYLRMRPENVSRARYLLFAQLGCAALCAIFMLTRVSAARGYTLSEEELALAEGSGSLLQPGLFLAILGSLAMLGGTLMHHRTLLNKD